MCSGVCTVVFLQWYVYISLWFVVCGSVHTVVCVWWCAYSGVYSGVYIGVCVQWFVCSGVWECV